MMYKNIKTEYVRKKIKGKSFKDQDFRDYIDVLIMIESYLAGEYIGWAGGIAIHHLKKEYKKEYAAIEEELLPDWKKKKRAQKRKIERKKEIREQKKIRKEEKKKLKREEKEWLKLGGKP